VEVLAILFTKEIDELTEKRIIKDVIEALYTAVEAMKIFPLIRILSLKVKMEHWV